jgi:hypothetical protein
MPGNATDRFVAEINIPEPVISATKEVTDLNEAVYLQDFADIRSPNQPLVPYSWVKGPALEYIPAQTGQTEGYLYTCFGDYYQWNGERLKSFGASRTDLSNPSPVGGWYIGSETPFSQPYYMTFITFNFELPYAIDGHLLVAGGSRPGDVHHGVTLIAYSPWNDAAPLPADDAHLNYTPLLVYDADAGTNRLNGYTYCDAWNGGAWLSAGGKQAVVISGLKGRGREWYGYDNGESTFNVMYNVPIPIEPEDHAPRQSNFDPMLLFYDGVDLQDVATGAQQSWEPQPYAVLDLTNYMFGPVNTGPNYGQRFRGPGGIALDRQNQLIYIMERAVTGVDSTEAIVHVFHLNPVIGLAENQKSTGIQVFAENHRLHVNLGTEQYAIIEVFDPNGQLLYRESGEKFCRRVIEMNAAHGVLIVRVAAEQEVLVQKLLF